MCLILVLVLATETVKGIKILKELLIVIVGSKEVLKSDDAITILVDDSHELVCLLLDMCLLLRSELYLLGAGLLTTLLEDGSLKNLTKSLLGQLAGALAVSKSEGSGELGLLISDTNAHEKKELAEVHLAGLLAAEQTPNVLVHLTLLLITVAFLVKEPIPVHLVDDLLGVVLAHLLEGKLDLMVRLSIKTEAEPCITSKIILIKRRQHAILCTHSCFTETLF